MVKKIATPQILWNLFLEYEEWCAENYLTTEEYVGQAAKKVDKKYRRAMSWFGFESYLCRFKDIRGGLSHYEANKPGEGNYDGYPSIILDIKNAIKDEQVSGAMVGIYNANLTARLNGIVEKTENKNDVNVKGEYTISFDIT